MQCTLEFGLLRKIYSAKSPVKLCRVCLKNKHVPGDAFILWLALWRGLYTTNDSILSDDAIFNLCLHQPKKLLITFYFVAFILMQCRKPFKDFYQFIDFELGGIKRSGGLQSIAPRNFFVCQIRGLAFVAAVNHLSGIRNRSILESILHPVELVIRKIIQDLIKSIVGCIRHFFFYLSTSTLMCRGRDSDILVSFCL